MSSSARPRCVVTWGWPGECRGWPAVWTTPRQAAALSSAAVQAGLVLQVLVEVDVGQGPLRVADAAAAVSLAMTVSGLPGLSFSGLQGYHGAAQHFRLADERAAAHLRSIGEDGTHSMMPWLSRGWSARRSPCGHRQLFVRGRLRGL